jgi:predicted DNA-binding antitoxin AbrB/MazE fold protein
MIVKARYENNVLKPLDKLNLKEAEEVDIELKDKSPLRSPERMDDRLSIPEGRAERSMARFLGYLRLLSGLNYL